MLKSQLKKVKTKDFKIGNFVMNFVNKGNLISTGNLANRMDLIFYLKFQKLNFDFLIVFDIINRYT